LEELLFLNIKLILLFFFFLNVRLFLRCCFF
jgi:hypothetical protein